MFKNCHSDEGGTSRSTVAEALEAQKKANLSIDLKFYTKKLYYLAAENLLDTSSQLITLKNADT